MGVPSRPCAVCVCLDAGVVVRHDFLEECIVVGPMSMSTAMCDLDFCHVPPLSLAEASKSEVEDPGGTTCTVQLE